MTEAGFWGTYTITIFVAACTRSENSIVVHWDLFIPTAICMLAVLALQYACAVASETANVNMGELWNGTISFYHMGLNTQSNGSDPAK
jgi:hypothetical protein